MPAAAELSWIVHSGRLGLAANTLAFRARQSPNQVMAEI